MTVNHDVTGSSPVGGATKSSIYCYSFLLGSLSIVDISFKIQGVEYMVKFSMTKQKFINQWLRHFPPALSKEQEEKYVKDQ